MTNMKAARTFIAALALATLAAPATAAGGAVAPALAERIDVLTRDGYEHPEEALRALTHLRSEHEAAPEAQRLLLQAIGTVEALSGASARAAATADRLRALAVDDLSGRMQASADLVRAKMAEANGQTDVAANLAQSALTVLQADCRGATPQSGVPEACDYRAVWTLLAVLERRARGLGVPVTATRHAQAALDLAEAAGDTRRQALNLSALALLAQGRGEPDAATWLLAQARRVGPTGDAAFQGRLFNIQAQLAALRGDKAGHMRALEEALALAVQSKSPRLETQMLVNLGDAYARQNRPADALRLAERALPIARRYNDVSTERVLVTNIGIAKIGVGRVADGRHDLARALELWQQTGEMGRQVQTLFEYGEALAQAGDARGALELYHRERALSAELMRVNRTIALKDLQSRNDAEARERDIELLSRDNALKTEALANRDLQQRIWWLLAAVMALASVLVALLYRRVREANRRLAASHLQLQAQSERDPLTNLANRRHFQAVMTARSARSQGFEGALLLVDIDHFKRINDGQGHATGDQVLVEVARRLNQAVRSDDLVVRWGGEEFLILAPSAAPEQIDQMALRVLNALGSEPVRIGKTSLQVTASIGYARFPLPPYTTDVPWEQAINLADMALYTAKNQGRNRAVGIVSTRASTREALREIEADFDQAWHAGRVTLLQTPGPEPRDDALRAA